MPPLWLLLLLIPAMMTGPLLVIQAIVGDGPWLYLLPVSALVVGETIMTTRWLQRPQQRQLNHWQYRLAEAIFLLLFIRLLTWAISGTNLSIELLLTYWREPINFLDGPFLVFTLLTLIIWQEAIYLTSLLLSLPLDEAELNSLKPGQREQRPRFSDRSALAVDFLSHWLYGGIILLGCTALITIDIPTLGQSFDLRTLGRINLPPLLLAALMLYLLVGLWLYGLIRWQTIKARWQVEYTTIQPELEQTWRRSVAWLIAGVAIAAAFLPIGSTIGLAHILTFLLNILFALVQMFVLLAIFLLSLPMLLFGRPSGVEIEEPPPLAPLEPTDLFLPPPPTDEPNLLVNGILWLALLAGTVAAVLFFLRQRDFAWVWPALRQQWVSWWLSLKQWWQDVRDRVTEMGQELVARGRDQVSTSAPSPWSFFRLSTLSPREQIRYFYLAAVRRAGEKGVPRQQAETPLEFAQDMKQNWPEAEGEIDQLTDAFLHARYSPQPVSPEQVNPIKQTWKRVKTSLRRRRAN